MPAATEINFDGLIGPTHNFAGLAHGNLASTNHAGRVASPKQAALQGLAKMKLLAELGVPQAVLPPQPRPDLATLRQLGFAGSDVQVVERVWHESPQLLAACYSASSMWAANAATVSPSADTADGRAHITPANLVSQLHRSIEASFTHRVLSLIFRSEKHFAVHAPLPPAMQLADEGAANHTRLCSDFGEPGIEIFTYGRVATDMTAAMPSRFPARQTREASQAVARRHQLRSDDVMYVQQSPAAIDAGVFHNDVIVVGHRDLLLCHERAYVDTQGFVEEVSQRFSSRRGKPLKVVMVKEQQVPLRDAVSSYLFNSQIVSLPDESMAIICPVECMEHDSTRRFLDDPGSRELTTQSRHVVDLRQSMNNGGGPACLRLRVVLTKDELAAVHPGVLWSPTLHEKLTAWVQRHYRDELQPGDLRDPKLIEESRTALEELTGILGMPGLYG